MAQKIAQGCHLLQRLAQGLGNPVGPFEGIEACLARLPFGQKHAAPGPFLPFGRERDPGRLQAFVAG